MGVHGLWKLIESSGKPVPLETLENKVLAVDVSIWLYQLVKGFQEKAGQSVSNAFLLGLFHRICKLLFYRIKPIFVFDGGVPALKRMTIAARQINRSKAEVLGEKLRMSLLENLAKQEALGKALGESFVLPKMFQPKQDTLFKLPPLPTSDEVDEEDDSDLEQESFRYKDLHSIDIDSEEFLSLPSDMRHDILTELKETRKENSWAKLHLMPEEGSEFSNFQMSRLLKRRAIQVGIEQAEGEMGTRGFTISDLQTILSEQGVELAQRIAADNTTKLLYNDYMNNASKPFKSRNIKVSSKEKKKSGYEDFPKEDDADWSEKTENGPKNDSLTQNEILEIIKMENSIPSDLKTEESHIEDSSAHLDLKNDFVKTEVEKESEVNDQTRENTSRNNKTKLEHGTLPQSSSHCQVSSLPSTSSHLVFISDPESEKPKAYENETNLNISIENSSQFGTFHKSNDSALSSDEDISSEVTDSYLKFEIIKDNNEVVLGDLNKSLVSNTSFHNTKEISEMSISSDDSDDFIEVDNKDDLEVTGCDSSSLVPDIPRKMECSNHLIPSEIIIDSFEEPEDDMFLDVFRKKCKSENKAINGFEAEKKQLESKLQIYSGENVLTDVILTEPSSTSNKEKTVLNGTNVSEPNIKEDNRKSVPQLSIDEIIKMKRDLERESDYLRSEATREDRIASTITEQIRLDAQELLQLFGIPYIVAPMEAEAQCAYLDLSNQTQGTITDDSDIWLFGAKNVYKNFFDQKKFVQQFKSTDISRCFHMGRDEMIMLALLSGSDYTTGLAGVGAVTALEVIAYFPKTEKEATVVQRLSHFVDDFKKLKLKANISSKLKKISISEGFPSVDVIKAYMEPLVDQTIDPFSWSKPNLGGLRKYALEKFGWDETRTNKILQPVFENLSRTESQGTLHRYFEWKFDGIENQMSKRVGKAITLMKTPSLLDNLPSTSKTKRNIISNSSSSKPTSQIDSNLLVKSKTPAQIARERAAKKVKELRKQGKFGPKFKNKKEK